MTDWTDLHPAIARAVASLPEGGCLLITRDAPECSAQFCRTGATVRVEVCNESPADEPRLRSRGWSLVDEWSGVWRREWPVSADPAEVEGLVAEVNHPLRNLWRQTQPDGFSYLAWQERAPKAAWQFWKSDADVDLAFPDLGLPKGKPRKD